MGDLERRPQDQFPLADKVLCGNRSNLLALVILSVFIALVLMAGAQKSETVDEGLFIAGGAAQVQYLNPNIDLSHPPLLRWISGLSSTYLGGARISEPVPFLLRGPIELFPYKVQDVFDFSIRFFYHTGNKLDRVLFWGRFPFAFLGALTGLLIFQFVRKYFGLLPSLVSFLTFAFIPEVLAHSQWAHADVASSLTIFLIAIVLFRALSQQSWKTDTTLGAVMGIASATKLTVLVVWPLIIVLLAVFHSGGFLRFLRRITILLTVFYIAIVIAYLPDPRLLGHEFYRSDLVRLGIEWIEPALKNVPLPDTFLKGIVYTLLLGQRGQIAFFHGEVSTTGWWYYFPVAIFLKYPTGLLLVAATGLIALWRGALPRAIKAVFTFLPLTILVAAMIQSVNIGVRSVLPVAPFLAVWCGAAVWYWRSRIMQALIGILLATSVASGILAFPDFLTYFNPLVGGTAAADKWLVDSNLDWGQDLPALAEELKRRDVQVVRLSYFGMGRPSYYGIKGLDPHVITTGWYAISRTYLSGWWPPGDPYAWLRSLRPVKLIGGSIALFYIDEEALSRSMKMDEESIEERMMKIGLEALYELNNYKKATEQFRKVLERNPAHYGATFQLAMALDRSGKTAEALPFWEKVLQMAEAYDDKSTADIARERLKKRH